MNYLRVSYVAIICSLVVTAANAQEPQPAQLYERGVNAYFSGRSFEADTLLSEAIQWNSTDPCAYYFRALSLLRQGRIAEAQGDMLVGATLEMQSPRGHAVGTALERVQGCDRLMLEKFRSQARRDAVTQASATSELPNSTLGIQRQSLPPSRPQTFREPDGAVLREHRIVPLEELLRAGGPQTIVEQPEQQSQPAAPVVTPAEKAAPSAAPAGNPFGDDTPASKSETAAPEPAKPAAEPPKVPPQTAPAPTPPASTPAKSDENPFG